MERCRLATAHDVEVMGWEGDEYSLPDPALYDYKINQVVAKKGRHVMDCPICRGRGRFVIPIHGLTTIFEDGVQFHARAEENRLLAVVLREENKTLSTGEHPYSWLVALDDAIEAYMRGVSRLFYLEPGYVRGYYLGDTNRIEGDLQRGDIFSGYSRKFGSMQLEQRRKDGTIKKFSQRDLKLLLTTEFGFPLDGEICPFCNSH